jgi:CelD/BcsL family acetyltransferase involved in cellulose biosynthesis
MSASLSPSVRFEPVTGYGSHWFETGEPQCLFVSPPWLRAWWEVFGDGSDLNVLAVRKADDVIGIAPLVLTADTARFIGTPDVCDYLDFAVSEGKGADFFDILIRHLRRAGIVHLDLWPLHPESTVLKGLAGLTDRFDCRIVQEPDESVFEMRLPSTWDAFLKQLSGKQRHEIRRKIRRLEDAGDIDYRVVCGGGEITDAMEVFLALFQSNRPDKAEFMSGRMRTYFQRLATYLAKAGSLRLFFLDIDGTPVASTMCFDHQSTTYLYNNGYDERYRSLSVGMVSKAMSIRYSIHEGKQRYSFLKGDESYKKRLGGNEVQLYRCRIGL